MNKIIRDNYPASKLPEDLREGIDPATKVTVIVQPNTPPDQVMSLEEIFALRRPPFRSAHDILGEIRQLRDEWDD
jgi:hypothetical protein